MTTNPVAASASARRRRPVRNGRRWWWPFIVPASLLVALFFVVPFLLNVRFAFTTWTGYNDDLDFSGFSNYQELIEQGILQNSLRVTLVFALVSMLIQNSVSLSLALLLEKTSRINTVFRSIFFIPVLIAPVAAGYIWQALLAPEGPVNGTIRIFAPGFAYAWLGHPTSALISVAFVEAWKWSGLATLVYIAGLNAVPRTVLEAAILDGTTAWQRFWRVRFPLLAPAFTFTVVTSLMGSMNAYDVVMATTVGGPGVATNLLNIAMWHEWSSGFFGTASALGLTLTLVVVVATLPLVRYLRSREVAA